MQRQKYDPSRPRRYSHHPVNRKAAPTPTPTASRIVIPLSMMFLKTTLLSLSLICCCMIAVAQDFPRNEAEFDSMYQARVQQEVIDGVYIPKDLQDAFAELRRLSAPADLEKFRSVHEDTVRTRLHFGLGRWMIVNWGFYEGSRMAHYLREAGLVHPDDMARVLIVTFHRHLNQKELQFAEEVARYSALREEERLQRESEKKVISDETRQRKQ